MTQRLLYLDACAGERRGVVFLGERPERLIIERDGDPPSQALGARVAGRVRRVEPALALAFVDLGEGPDGALNLAPDAANPPEGAVIAVEIRAQARRGKGATLRRIDAAAERPGLLAAGPSLEARLRAAGGEGAEIIGGAAARAAADAAQEAALAVTHSLTGGGSIAIELTRALTAVDVDVGAGVGASAKQAARSANLAAIGEAGRLLRLKGLGGLVVIDLVGRRHDGQALLTAARSAFAPDNPGVAFAPVSRFGTLELTLPRRETPACERLTDPDGSPSVRALAMDLLRDLEREAVANPGARLEARAAAAVIAEAAPFLGQLTARLGARLTLLGVPQFARDRREIRAP